MKPKIVEYLSHHGINIYIPDYKTLYFCMVLFFVLFSTTYGIKRGMPTIKFYQVTILIPFFSFIGARIYYILEHFEYSSQSSFLALLSGTGTASYGAYTGTIISAIVLMRLMNLDILNGLDIYAPTLAFCMSIGRIGCFMKGCCYGKFSDLPWAVSYPVNSPVYLSQLADGKITNNAIISLPVHPTQIYEALFGFAFFIFLILLNKKKKIKGISFFIWFASYAFFRFFIEFLRGDDRSFLALFSVPQIFSIVIFGFSIIGLLYCFSKIANS